MDKLQQVKAKLEEMKAKYNQERDEEENPLHSDGNGMYWSGFFTCLKEITSIVDSLPEESANEDLEEEIKDFFEERETWDSESQPSKEDIARHFANWQKKQMEAYRIKHCNNITNEQAELESDFVSKHVEKNNRMPTFLDAIEYGMELQKNQMMKDANTYEVESRYDRRIGKYLAPDITLNEQMFNVGDEVKLIIIKNGR